MKHAQQEGDKGEEQVSAAPPSTPGSAATVFGDRLRIAVRYVELLADTGISHGLLGPREAPRLWDRHVLNSAVTAAVFDPDATVADLGSGAGLPGIPLAIARPDLHVTLVEPLLRRSVWLIQTIDELGTIGLANVSVVRARAQDLPMVLAEAARTDLPSGGFRHVTARAVARIGALAEMSADLLELGGSIHALKGSNASVEAHDDHQVLDRMGFGPTVIRQFGEGALDQPTTVVSAVLLERPPRPSRPRSTTRSGRRTRSARSGRRRQ